MFEVHHAKALPQHRRQVPYHRAVPVSAHDIAAALRTRYPGLPKKKLHKLLYYCQAHHLAAFGEPLFTQAIEAWDMGPVVADLWAHEKYDAPPSPQSLGERELNTVGYTLSRYGTLTGKDLEVLSHGEDPWLTANQGRNPGGRAVIKHEWITAYFRNNASTEGEELGAQGEAVLSRWVRKSVRPSVAPGRPLSREELVVEFDRIESGLGDR